MARLIRWGAGLLLVAWIVSIVAVVRQSRRDEARPADAIIVLGAAHYVGRPSPVLKARLDHAVALWKRGLAPRVILTGGIAEGDTTSEAAVGGRYVRKEGVPDSAIILETRGRTTRQSLRAAATLMRARGTQRAILVSDPFHMLRLRTHARRLGITPYTSPTRTSPISKRAGEQWSYIFAESVKVPLAMVF